MLKIGPTAAAPELLELVQRARRILELHLSPDGISDAEAMDQMYGIFDGADFRRAMRKAGLKPEDLATTEYYDPTDEAPEDPSEKRPRLRVVHD